ncbi:hypothetical protein NC651_017512 [Populus alba x Populus x berolinensis]|nr:hypothetical protein NC651_017512 [Populus alba x Populus x berolinensis]
MILSVTGLSDAARAAGYDGLITSDQTSNMEALLKKKTTSYALSIVKWEAGTLPALSGIGYEPVINSTAQNLSPNQFQFSSFPGVTDMSEFSMNSHIVSPSQEGSTISDSSSLAMDNKGLSVPSTNGGLEDVGILMDSELGFPSDFFNGLLLQDKASEAATNCYQYFADFGYVDIKP